MALPKLRWHRVFQIGVTLKGLHALMEIAGGLVFHFVPVPKILHWANLVMQDELIEDPRDFLATHLLIAAQQLSIEA
ncbi:DUF2127 domain-containing protein [Limimaricola sp. G21655-S1]|nr:DUF2127 domain-containing protein [Limimaricola sp. G21655-S1]MCZ4262234.1 DUF2127 domain-containing protein [Limimaricola sp. G21655-S1]